MRRKGLVRCGWLVVGEKWRFEWCGGVCGGRLEQCVETGMAGMVVGGGLGGQWCGW